MYISKLILDASIPMVRKHLSSLDLLYTLLDDLTFNKGFLYRIEDVPLNESGFLQPILLVSREKPNKQFSEKPEGFLSSIQSVNYEIPIRAGMNYSFYLKANPASKFFFKVSEINGTGLQEKWLESESFKKGFELIQCSVSGDGYITCESDKVKYLSAVFTGALKVTDTDRFRKTLIEGIGYGTKYGLGLLSVETFGCRNRDLPAEMKNQNPS